MPPSPTGKGPAGIHVGGKRAFPENDPERPEGSKKAWMRNLLVPEHPVERCVRLAHPSGNQ